MNYADIHTHILHETDDGAKTVDTALRMLDKAYRAGTQTVFLTPHCSTDQLDMTAINKRFTVLSGAAKQLFPGLSLFLGTELMYSAAGIEAAARGDIPTLAGSRYLLIEFFPSVTEREVVSAVSKAVQAGLVPIIAHVERYRELSLKKISKLVDMGALIQVNARSITGELFTRMRVNKLLRAKLVHFVASDAHDPEIRSPILADSEKQVRERFGQAYTEKIFCENALAVSQDEMI